MRPIRSRQVSNRLGQVLVPFVTSPHEPCNLVKSGRAAADHLHGNPERRRSGGR